MSVLCSEFTQEVYTLHANWKCTLRKKKSYRGDISTSLSQQHKAHQKYICDDKEVLPIQLDK